MKAAILQALFRIYKGIVSPVLHAVGASQCIFLPTCSEYAFQAVSKYGFLHGTRLAFARLARCHPLSRGGFDPVP